MSSSGSDLVQIEIPQLETIKNNPPSSGETAEVDARADNKSAEYALHILFTQFVRQTERKLNLFSTYPDDSVLPVDELLSEGADPEFDKVLTALGHVARRKPKPVIDSVMYWRKTKSDQDTSEVQHKHKSLIGIYILSRVLIEVVKQAPPAILGEDLSEKLEDIVFKQLLSDPKLIKTSSVRRANWVILAKLLGHLSLFRLSSITERFVAELEKLPSVLSKSQEEHAMLVVSAMKYLKVQLYPEEFLEESAAFLECLSEFYSKTKSLRLKGIYSEVLSFIFEGIAGPATAEVNHPTWAAATKVLFNESIATMKRSFEPSLLLAVNSLCVSPSAFFAPQWLTLLEMQMAKSKARSSSPSKLDILFQAGARFLWVYVNRCQESLNSTTRKLESIRKLFFSVSKRPWFVLEQLGSVAACFMLSAAFKGYQQFTLDELVLPMLTGMSAHEFIKTAHITLETVVPERACIAVYAFVNALHELRTGEGSPFPTTQLLRDFPQQDYKASGPVPASIPGSLAVSIELIGDCIGKIARILSQVTCMHTTDPVSKQSSVAHLVGLNLTTNRNSAHMIKLFLAIIKSYPWWAVEQPRFWDILCENVDNSSSDIANAASESICELARTADVRALLITVTKRILNVDQLIFTNYELPRAPQLDMYLRVYVAIIGIWIKRIESGDPGFEDNTQDLTISAMWSMVDEIEGNGLLFLCSQNTRVRTLALRILWLASELDTTITQFSKATSSDSDRVIHFLEKTLISDIVNSITNNLDLSMPERTRLVKFKARKSANIARLADSDYGVDAAIWFKIFPVVVSRCFEKFPISVALCRDVVCARVVQMHDVVTQVVGSSQHGTSPFLVKHPMRTHAEIVVEQWRLYLIVACSTLTATDEQKLHIPNNFQTGHHSRKKSTQRITLHHQRIMSAKSVFKILITIIGTNPPMVRDSVIVGISCINVITYKTLLECLYPVIKCHCAALIPNQSQSVPKSELLASQRVLTDVTEILRLTSHFLADKTVKAEKWAKQELNDVLEHLYRVLTVPAIQMDYSFQSLRQNFCGFLANYYTAIGTSSFSEHQWLKFWRLIEEFSPFGRYATIVSERDSYMKRARLATAKDIHEQSVIMASIEFERRKLEEAVSRAMSVLVKGKSDTFEWRPVLNWCYSLFSSNRASLRDSGSEALKNLLILRGSNSHLISEVITRVYADSKEGSEVGLYYFKTFVQVLLENPDMPLSEERRLLVLAIFKIGSDVVETRFLAIHLLQLLELRLYGGDSCPTYPYRLQSSTPSVYKREIFTISSTLAKARKEDTFAMVSCLTMAFHDVYAAGRRDILSALLPWLQNIELPQVAPGKVESVLANSITSPETIMLLSNLFELTLVFSDKMQHENEALWVSLCTGPGSANNVDAILQFLMTICFAYGTQKFINYSRRILVYLSTALPEQALFARLVQYLEPRSMVSQQVPILNSDACHAKFSYVADLASLAQAANGTATSSNDPGAVLPPLSYTQMAAVLLTDVASSKETLLPHVKSITHLCICLFDHFIPLVQQSVSELLAYVVGLVGSSEYLSAESLICKISSSRWHYDDMNSSLKTQGSITTPEAMVKLVRETVEFLQQYIPDFDVQWSREAIKWATTCPVRHVACRSFQTYRCIPISVDHNMLADMLARLSSTISESSLEIQGFSIQILMTLNAIADFLSRDELLKYPCIFWTTFAAMTTANEKEYIEALSIMSKLLAKLDLTEETTKSELISGFPQGWEGEQHSLMDLVLLGLRSCNSYKLSLDVANQLIQQPESSFLDDTYRIPLALAANLPQFLHAMDKKSIDKVTKHAQDLERLCMAASQDSPAFHSMVRILNSFYTGKFWSKPDFLQQYVSALCTCCPESKGQVLIMLMGTLSVRILWVRRETMSILKLWLPRIDFQNDDGGIANLGADIVSPLLRLLQTDFAEQALDVLDEATSIVGRQMDKHVLRMSLGSKQLAREYESTNTLFGIPEESGWAIAKPAIMSSVTRNNVHSVFLTYKNLPIEQPMDDISFQGDDFAYSPYAHHPMMQPESHEANNEGMRSMDHMLSVLDDLDSFFTKTVNPKVSHGDDGFSRKHSAVTESSLGDIGERNESISIPHLYDKKVSLILSRSLQRTASAVSFRTSFADSGVDQRRRPHKPSSLSNSQSFNHIVQDFEGSESSSTISHTATEQDEYSRSQSVSVAKRWDSEEMESPFRLESLLKSKKTKKEKDRRRTQANQAAFQFP